MKKLLLVFVICFFAHNTYAQFILSPNGFVGKDGNSEYIVIEFKDKSQSALYTSTLKYLNTSFHSPKTVISPIENELITINAESEFGTGKMIGYYTSIYIDTLTI